MANKNIIRLSVSEAARLFGVSTKTIRKAIKADDVKYIVVKGRYKIQFESLLKWSQQSTRRKNIRDKRGIGQHVNQWQIGNKKYSPHPKLAAQIADNEDKNSAKSTNKKSRQVSQDQDSGQYVIEK